MRISLRFPECNHIEYSTLAKPEGGLFKIMDAFQCKEEVQGAWWIVKGPSNTGQCLLSWVTLYPNEYLESLLLNNQLSALGYTQH